MSPIVIVLLVILCLGGIPWGGYHSYGYGPSGFLGLILVIVLILFLMGRF